MSVYPNLLRLTPALARFHPLCFVQHIPSLFDVVMALNGFQRNPLFRHRWLLSTALLRSATTFPV
jgi:hypothetical protein